MPLHDVHRRQKVKNMAIALGLAGFLITLAKFSPEPGQ